MSDYQSYLFSCDCEAVSRGIIFKDLIPVCRYCREPLVKGGILNYNDEHFVRRGYFPHDHRHDCGNPICPMCHERR